ncbi:nucleotidyltransferase family protein [Sulfurisphaera ohwakuensis]|uniref:nucleotidyltransferase family protein n=1 Tax=Sulfurisphaera ohwakuensis TaxID=69656 RepID=UPI0036F1ACB5
MKLTDVLDKLKAFKWTNYDLYFAVLFGSLAKKGEGNDIDIAVEFKKRMTLENYTRLWIDLTDYLNTEKVDLTVINERTDCYLIHEVFSNSIILYMEDWWRIHRRAVICEDFLIDAKKLNVIENAARALVRKWQS